MQACIGRAQEVNPAVNAIVAERYAEALEEAQAVDRQLSQDPVPEELSEDAKPFLGIPFTVKEAFALEGEGFQGTTAWPLACIMLPLI